MRWAALRRQHSPRPLYDPTQSARATIRSIRAPSSRSRAPAATIRPPPEHLTTPKSSHCESILSSLPESYTRRCIGNYAQCDCTVTKHSAQPSSVQWPVECRSDAQTCRESEWTTLLAPACLCSAFAELCVQVCVDGAWRWLGLIVASSGLSLAVSPSGLPFRCLHLRSTPTRPQRCPACWMDAAFAMRHRPPTVLLLATRSIHQRDHQHSALRNASHTPRTLAAATGHCNPSKSYLSIRASFYWLRA